MKIIFYPRDIGLWRKTFDFKCFWSGNTPSQLGPSKVFYTRNELMEFCREHGVRFDEPNHPFRFDGPDHHHVFGDGTYTIHQWTVLGWAKESA